MSHRVIEAKTVSLRAYLKKVYLYRSFLYTLTYRDLKVQYAQTVLGLFWSVIQPITGLLIFTFFFGYLLDFEKYTPNIPYPLFAFTGMIAWYFFTYIVNHSGMSLIVSQPLITKLYFPRLILPLSKVLMGMVEFGISLAILIFIMIILGYYPNINVIFFPVFIVLNIITGMALGVWLSALTIRYRDFQHIIPYLVSFGIWFTPVFYPTSLLPTQVDQYIYINPMAGVIAGYRWTLLGGEVPQLYYYYAFVPVFILLITGLYYFRRLENILTDYL